LPNLETKFVAANTLIGIDRPKQQLLRNPEIDVREEELRSVRERHFLARTPATKAKCREQDTKLRAEIAEMLRRDGWDSPTARKLADWDPYDQNASAGFFDTEWMFGNLTGFDVVIANPPYLKERDNKHVFDLVTTTLWGSKYHVGKMDYWYFFLHRALEIAAPLGVVSFITSRYWINSAGSKKVIEHVRRSAAIFHVVDIGSLPVFEQVAGHHMLHFYRAGAAQSSLVVKTLRESLVDIAAIQTSAHMTLTKLAAKDVFTEGGEIRLYAPQLVLESTLTLGDRYEVSQGVVQNPDKVSAVMAQRYGLARGEGVFVLDDEELNALNLNDSERAFVQPFYDESAIQRFYLERSASKHLLYITKKNCASLRGLRNLERHLERYREIMDARRETVSGSIEWFQLHWPRDPRFFTSPKVVLPSMFLIPNAAFIPEPAYFGLGSNVVIGVDKAFTVMLLCGLLNSNLAQRWFDENGKQRGVGVDVGVDRLRQFPLPPKSDKFAALERLVDSVIRKRLQNPGVDTSATEKAINDYVYELYGLSRDQISAAEKYIHSRNGAN
jgi:adenine-specific DNA-methyltransferase